MKIDRLLGITIYLLNHKKASAQTLSTRFEVSVRTIIRDIEVLCMAGIPVVSTYGVDGGYEILDSFKLERQIAGINDYSYIVAALQGLVTAYKNKEIEATLEKVRLQADDNSANIILDFDALHENGSINQKLSLFERAIKEKHMVSFQYTNAENEQKVYEVEPVATMYKCHNWYLLCYHPQHQDDRVYKLIHMEEVIITDKLNSMDHEARQAKQKWERQSDASEYIDIKLQCSREIKIRCIEYLKGVAESELDNGDIILSFTVPKNEQFWYGTILSFGNQVKVLEPIELRQKIIATCNDIITLYQNI